MATDEGVFPKIGNDPLFDSEVNRFSPKLIGNINQSDRVNISGTNFAPIGGAITYPGTGSMQISQFMQVQAGIGKQNTATTLNEFRIRTSGTADLDLVSPTWSISATNIQFGNTINYILTSGVMTASGGNIGSSYIITLEARNNSNDVNAALFGDFVIIGY